MTRNYAFSDDLPIAAVYGALLLALLGLAFLLLELRRRQRYGFAIFATGVVAVAGLVAAVMRPVQVRSQGTMMGPRVVVLVDQSRRLLLPADAESTRRARALEVMAELPKRFTDARLTYLGFADKAPTPMLPDAPPPARGATTDLAKAVAELAADPAERPRAVVVVSDGRFERPTSSADDAALRRAVAGLGVPIHAVKIATTAPKDASVRSVRAAGAAVAHQPLALTIDIGCAGGLACGEVPVRVRELRRGTEPALLASGTATVTEGEATVELTVTLERAGTRIVEVAIDAPAGDVVAENNRRIMEFEVTRDRIRLLHVAGRPTYDVRALRMWLKSDQSVDVVAFFILRTDTDEPGTFDESELALIPFPVDELFTEHLPSFDAVVLQDIDAVRYKLARYLPKLAHYVESGGGLIMVGGPTAFVGGNYASTALERVLPVSLAGLSKPYETAGFVPRYTEAGRAAPVLGGVRRLFGDQLAEVAGSNTVGPARDGAIVLWEHPIRKAGAGAMPVLALGEAGDGRSIALSIDGTHRLGFGKLAASAAGRGYGALWDGLLGWLMRDPRYEIAQLRVVPECIAGEPTTLRLTRPPGAEGDVKLVVTPLAPGAKAIERIVKSPADGPLDIDVGKLAVGGYSAKASVGAAPPTRQDFACERGGVAWSDSRPNPQLLDAVARVTGGMSVKPDAVASLALPKSTRVAVERRVSPLAPPWAWSLAAALLLSIHWLVRRRGGLI